jgi:hypothetical protein
MELVVAEPLDMEGSVPKDKDRNELIVERVLREFGEAQQWRATTAQHWEEVAELILPTSRNTFYYGSYNWPGQKKTDRQIDATGMLALSRFTAICDSLLTPRNMFWHGLEAEQDYLMKDRQVREYFETATKILFKLRYAPTANFAGQNHAVFENLGAFGNGAMFVDRFDDPAVYGVRYKCIPVGELFFKENHQGLVDGFIRWIRLTARQAKQRWPETFPEELKPALEKGSESMFDFLHYVAPRTDDYDPIKLDWRGMKFQSVYVSIQGKCLLQEGGYKSFPLTAARYVQTPGEVYGRSPAMMVLPSLKTLNAQKATFLKQGHRAADPVLLTGDDGIVDFSMRPGALNKGAMTPDGKPLISVLPHGDIQISKEMMADEKSIINDAFLVTLFQILTETPQMTATEVIERTNEKGILLAPTIGRQQSEYLGPLIDRELDLCSQMRLLPPMPAALLEARGGYNACYTSPISRAMRAQEAAGFMRVIENLKEIVAVTQDVSIFDPLNFDRAVPAIADIQAVPVSWMSTDKEIGEKRKGRAAQQQRAEQIQAMPAQAAMISAQSKAQGGQPQQGGGQPPGAQPQGVPGQ